ncbi:MAG: S-layer homology domain-containing protein [Cyanobacteria bacterium P01_E01_bin.48]
MIVGRTLTKAGFLGAAFSFLLMGPADVAVAANFADTDGHWAESYIDALSNAGVLGGFPDGSFKPNAKVTRAQFATIVNNAFELTNAPNINTFGDVAENYWAAGAISNAASSGLVAGFPNGTFQPESNVTRAQSLVVMTNALGTPVVNISTADNTLTRFRDANQIPSWAARHIATAARADLIVNYPEADRLEPNRGATRAEVAAFAYQTLTKQGRIDPIASQPDTARVTLSAVQGIPAGTDLPAVTFSDRRLYVAPNETRSVSLKISEPIRNDRGEVVVPYGSRVDGRFEPAPGGTRFVAESTVINNRAFALSAQSNVLRDVKDPRQTGTGQVVQDTALGAAAGALIGGFTGDRKIEVEEVLAGGAVGAAVGNVTAPRVVEIGPQQPIVLKLTRDFVVL